MSNFLKATAVRDTTLSALSRMLTLAPTVWRNAGGSFTGVLNDSITIRVPAYTSAASKAMRGSTSRSSGRRGLYESAVVVTLDTNIYRDVVLSDENQTLDILDFSRQVINPMLGGIARGIEDELLDVITDETYEYEVEISAASPYPGVVQARKALNDANVPFGNRTLAVGSSVEAALLESAQFARADQSGTTQTLREGQIGKIAGFDVVTSPALDPDEAYAYHQTAYALAMQAPTVPSGAPAGFTASSDGFAIRVVQILDSDTIQNVVAADVFVGASSVKDYGEVDSATGKFTPAENPDESGVEQVFVRGVKLELGS